MPARTEECRPETTDAWRIRERSDDVLVAESVPERYAVTIVEALNAKFSPAPDDEHFFKDWDDRHIFLRPDWRRHVDRYAQARGRPQGPHDRPVPPPPVARHCRPRLALANVGGALAGGFVGNAYLPDPYANASHGLTRSALALTGFATSNLADEFRPEIRKVARKLHLPFLGK